MEWWNFELRSKRATHLSTKWRSSSERRYFRFSTFLSFCLAGLNINTSAKKQNKNTPRSAQLLLETDSRISTKHAQSCVPKNPKGLPNGIIWWSTRCLCRARQERSIWCRERNHMLRSQSTRNLLLNSLLRLSRSFLYKAPALFAIPHNQPHNVCHAPEYILYERRHYYIKNFSIASTRRSYQPVLQIRAYLTFDGVVDASNPKCKSDTKKFAQRSNETKWMRDKSEARARKIANWICSG